MKLFIILFNLTSILLGLSIFAEAQTSSNTFQLGNKQIVIPAPVGFIEAASQIQEIKNRFVATEAAGNDFLAVHILKDNYQLLNTGKSTNLSFYTKVSVSKNLRNKTVNETDFASFVKTFKSYFPSYSDPKGDFMKSTLSRISGNLSSLNQEKTTVTIDKPYNLGEIVNDRNSYGVVTLSQITMKVGNTEGAKAILAGISAIRVQEKIIFVYTYKDYKNEQDITDLKVFSSNWLKQIAEANK